MNRDQLRAITHELGLDHQVFRIIQLDRRSGKAGIPDAIINRAMALELIVKGSTTDINSLPIS